MAVSDYGSYVSYKQGAVIWIVRGVATVVRDLCGGMFKDWLGRET